MNQGRSGSAEEGIMKGGHGQRSGKVKEPTRGSIPTQPWEGRRGEGPQGRALVWRDPAPAA